MPPTRGKQMFALPGRPPERVMVRAGDYRLERVFKHDFWAATCLYERVGGTGMDRVVVKFGRSQPFCGVPLDWVGELLADHEEAIYRAAEGVAGLPAWAGRLSPICYAIEYVDAPPLDHLDAPPAGFFDRLRELFDALHACGIAYGDANKKSNILVRPDGRPVLIDFQISLRRRRDWIWPFRAIIDRVVDYLQAKDIYHLYKHKRRLAPAELTAEEDALSRNRSGLHLLHRKLTKPYRSLRRRFLRTQHQAGQLESPTADLETHHQPEKESWRE